MKPWFYVMLVPWMAFIAIVALYILDYGFETIVPSTTGVDFWISVSVKAVMLFLPLIALPFALKRKSKQRN